VGNFVSAEGAESLVRRDGGMFLRAPFIDGVRVFATVLVATASACTDLAPWPAKSLDDPNVSVYSTTYGLQG
jgi:hypothetical protein